MPRSTMSLSIRSRSAPISCSFHSKSWGTFPASNVARTPDKCLARSARRQALNSDAEMMRPALRARLHRASGLVQQCFTGLTGPYMHEKADTRRFPQGVVLAADYPSRVRLSIANIPEGLHAEGARLLTCE